MAAAAVAHQPTTYTWGKQNWVLESDSALRLAEVLEKWQDGASLGLRHWEPCVSQDFSSVPNAPDPNFWKTRACAVIHQGTEVRTFPKPPSIDTFVEILLGGPPFSPESNGDTLSVRACLYLENPQVPNALTFTFQKKE